MQKDFAGTRPALIALFDKHRRYAQDSGDSFYLVRSFCSAGEQLLKHDPQWARELAHEAARWSPSNHHTWALLAKALEAEGDWRRAEAVYWNARRRFPHIAHSHNQLGHALLLHGLADLGETVFRQATRLFPDNPITWAELGNSLRITGRYEQAVAVYQEAQQMGFQRNAIIANALTDTLLDLNDDLTRAESALQWAEQVVPDDERSQQTLAKIQRRLVLAKNGRPLSTGYIQKPKETINGNLHNLADITGTDLRHAMPLGKARLWRWQGENSLSKAQAELNALHDGSAKLIEQGLIISAQQDWHTAFAYFDNCYENYAGDGALRVHRLRAQSRAGETVDWSQEKQHSPDLLPVIFTEENNRPPHYEFKLKDDDLSEEQKQQQWFSRLADKDSLRDWAEEDFLSARQVA
jgi:Flp pilus assembly protein TadD